MTDLPRPLATDEPFYQAVRDIYIKEDGSVSPGAFSNTTGTDAMSVDWADFSSPAETITRFPQWPSPKGVVSVPAQRFWDCQQTIAFDELPTNPAHSLIYGEKTGSITRKIAMGLHLIHLVE